MIGDYESLALSGTWPFPKYPTANLNTVIDDALTYETKTVGKIHGIVASGAGQEYNQAPVIRLIEPSVFRYDIPDTEILTMTDATGFQVGELLTQNTTSARGLIERVNGSNLHIQRLRFFLDDQFVNTISTGTQVMGQDSGVTSNVVTSTLRSTSNRYGDDLEIAFFVIVGSGVITAVQVIDSGLGFANGETVTLTSGNNTGNGTAILLTHGTGSGYYRSKDGFLSDDKKLSDGYYYQEYSYEVRSSVIDDFKSTLKNIVHVAGTKYFDALVYDTINPSSPTANTTTDQVSDNTLTYTSNVTWGSTRLVWGYV
jgi:hypothetical protein